ncbi:Muramoyltetrapeptide carboxypeptidase LdcA (peptidoglycan recycling) [Parapedobacter composti]|uniref:Muramoyltetrapeptide carboxypeptidase LdcA (Peptidoglycan recycling) n=1 Tax=Parapedobacter composti TaxID=623281 RepID=A0A1I1IMI7_9SPHI|nr:S66 peptidase family protein [Parapedobacter composti]SFC35488.1 Muramoyltetrapeptide carboxypeptidase LdcA (peptidoglycan recycling) [Parapedobacter composti]
MVPDKLTLDDQIRVIAPAQSLLPKLTLDKRLRAIERLEQIGLRVSFGDYISEVDEFHSTSVEHRLNDLHNALRDPAVKAILAVAGGTTSNQLLPHINYNLINDNPKIICGISDITALNNALFAKTGLVTYYGPHFNIFGASEDISYTLEYFKRCLFSSAPFALSPPHVFYNSPWEEEPVNNTGYWVINEGECKGKILGGNFLTFSLLNGSEYMPDIRGAVLFLEDNGPESAGNMQNQLQSLINHSDFDHVQGLVIGRFKQESGITRKLLTKIIKTKEPLSRIPVVANVDFGHTTPMITFPIGGYVRIQAHKDNIYIEISDHE